MTVNPGVGPVVRQRLRLSRRQKVGIFGVGTALVLGGLMVVHLFSGSPKQEDTRQQFAGTAGMPFTAPAPPAGPGPETGLVYAVADPGCATADTAGGGQPGPVARR